MSSLIHTLLRRIVGPHSSEVVLVQIGKADVLSLLLTYSKNNLFIIKQYTSKFNLVYFLLFVTSYNTDFPQAAMSWISYAFYHYF